MIELSTGFKIEIMGASGTFGFNKGYLPDRILSRIGYLDFSAIDVVVTKTMTRHPEEGNYVWYKPWGSIRFIKDGIVNAVGLTNPGIEWWCREVGPKLDSLKIPLIISIAGNANEIKEMALMLNKFKNIVAIELNEGCPNVCNNFQDTEEVIEKIKILSKISIFPIILKLSVVHQPEKIIPYIEDFIEAISINSVPWSVAFPNQENPFKRYGIEECGVSGKIIQSHTWSFAYEISEMISIPVIWPSVWESSDIRELKKMANAKAFSFGSIFFYPWKLREVLNKIGQNKKDS
ncbi:MAG: hypothetical protein KAQ87_02110 [Candidatus Pacebacteria bacterium]|nr:hypothetical protein [Candidatus Paceibacterota bacterium]